MITNSQRIPGLIRFSAESEKNNYYYRARYYSPTLQRFISEDPIGFRGGINKYAYVGNSPIIHRDPEGLEWKWGANANLLLFDYGWDSSNPSNANLSLDIGSLIGGGFQFTWVNDSLPKPIEDKNGKCNGQAKPVPLTWNIGLNKYLGISIGEDFSSVSLNIGMGIGLPLSVSSPIEGDYSFGAWVYDVTHPGE